MPSLTCEVCGDTFLSRYAGSHPRCRIHREPHFVASAAAGAARAAAPRQATGQALPQHCPAAHHGAAVPAVPLAAPAAAAAAPGPAANLTLFADSRAEVAYTDGGGDLHGAVRLVVLSDTHNQHRRIVVPPGDILVHLGDAADRGNRQQLEDFAVWFAAQPHRHKLFIYGNHDPVANSVARRILEGVPGCTLLVDAAVELLGVHFYGMSYAATLACDFSAWPAAGFVDVLLTHAPPGRARGRGPPELLRRVISSGVTLHLFGHTHWGRGAEEHQGVTFVNCSNVGNTSRNFEALPVAPPVLVDFDPKAKFVLQGECPDPVGASPEQLAMFYGRPDGLPARWPSMSPDDFELALQE
jgi:predicted phosphodiesterase